MPRIVILAGGISSRMKQLDMNVILDKKLIDDSNEKSKSMIRIGSGDKPFLDYLLFNIKNAGYNDVVIVVNEKDNSIINYYSDKKNISGFENLSFDFAVQPIPPGREKPLGTADALYRALIKRTDWKGKKFTMCNSDNLYSVFALKLLLNPSYPNSMIDYDSDGLGFGRDRIGRFSITKKDCENYLTDIIEKPNEETIDTLKEKDGYVGVSMNIFNFSYDMILPILEITPVNPIRNEKEITTSVKLMIEKIPQSVFAFRHKEYVPDLTSKSDIPIVKKFLDNKF
ncbi:MAG: sugar phosphate nucleotidyltransferase [Bacteroidota bacterium]